MESNNCKSDSGEKSKGTDHKKQKWYQNFNSAYKHGVINGNIQVNRTGQKKVKVRLSVHYFEGGFSVSKQRQAFR